MDNRQDPLPIIDQKRCTGCHACVDVCPTGALAQEDGKAALVRPDLCTYCTACQDICPEGAISLPFLIVFSRQKRVSAQPTTQGGQKIR